MKRLVIFAFAFAAAACAYGQSNCTTDKSKEVNLVCNSSGKPDVNNVPLNPDWGVHVDKNQLPFTAPNDGCAKKPNTATCTTQAGQLTTDTAGGLKAAACFIGCPSCIHGHVNWTPVTYEGRIGWMGLADDWDVNFKLLNDGEIGATAKNFEVPVGGATKKILELEFDSDETVANFTTSWWKELYSNARAHRDDDVAKSFYPSCPGAWPRGTVFGVINMDCEHGCRSEVHPVYGVAIETDPNPQHNTWVMFVRNWGNEGFCAKDTHNLNLTTVRLHLPHVGAAKPVVITGETEFAATAAATKFPDLSMASDGLVVSFDLPAAASRDLAELKLTLRWPGNGSTPACAQQVKPLVNFSAQLYSALSDQEKEFSAEKQIGEWFRQMNNNKGVFMQPENLTLNGVTLARIQGKKTKAQKVPAEIRIGDFQAPTAAPVKLTSVLDAKQGKRDDSLMRLVCSQHKGDPACKDVK